MKARLLNVAIAVDQLANALLAGQPDETLSSRAHLSELRRLQLPPSLRT